VTLKYKNNAQATLSSGINDSVTTITVSDGSLFPSLTGAEYFYLTLEDVSYNREIVKVTARSGNDLTVVRAQDNTTARAFSTSDKAELRMVSAILTDLSAPSYIVAALAGLAVSAASYNKVALTAPATGSTLTIADGKTLTASNTLTLTATDGSTLAIGAGGTLGAIAYVTPGTNVATALAVAVGSAGAVVVNGGALGTPSSGTLTNATGLPVAGIVASTSAALGVGSIELGHASDTTIARVSAGVAAIEGSNIITAATVGASAVAAINSASPSIEMLLRMRHGL
jgi:hypothetical protein